MPELASARNRAFRIIQIAEQHGHVTIGVAGLDAGRILVAVDTLNAERTGLDASLAARHFRILVGQRLMHEGTRLVRTGHHAVTTADADVPVDQDDAVGALHRSAGRADIDAGRIFAMLAEHRQAVNPPVAQVLDVQFADVLRILRAGLAGQAVFGVAGGDAIVAAVATLGGVDQHAPTHTWLELALQAARLCATPYSRDSGGDRRRGHDARFSGNSRRSSFPLFSQRLSLAHFFPPPCRKPEAAKSPRIGIAGPGLSNQSGGFFMGLVAWQSQQSSLTLA
jgi:hypothetical protein